MHDEDTVRLPLHARDGSVRAYAIVDVSDYAWASQYRWFLGNHGYAVRGHYVTGREIRGYWSRGRSEYRLLHRELLGATKGQIVDHINRARLDCRRSNMRLTNRAGNTLNKRMLDSNRSGYRGVCVDKNATHLKYRATIGVNRKQHHLGRFATPEEAACAYDVAARKYHGEYAQLNFSEE